MTEKKYPQAEYSRRYHEKHGIVQKKFNIDAETAALFESLSAQTGLPQVEILRRAIRQFAEQAD